MPRIQRGLHTTPTEELARIRPTKAQITSDSQKAKRSELKTSDPKAFEKLTIKEDKQVEDLVKAGKSIKYDNLHFASLGTTKLTSGKMELIDKSLKHMGIETMENKAAKLSKPSTWGRGAWRALTSTFKRGASMLVSGGLAIGQYLGHALGGIIGNGAIGIAQGIGNLHYMRLTSNAEKIYDNIESAFENGVDKIIDDKLEYDLQKLGEKAAGGEISSTEFKTQSEALVAKASQQKALARAQNPQYMEARNTITTLKQKRTIMNQDFVKAHKSIHKWLKDTSYQGSRKFDENMGLREKSITKDKVFEYMNSAEITDSAVGVVLNCRTIGVEVMKGMSLMPEVAKTVGNLAAPLSIAGEAVGVAADSFSIHKTRTRLDKLDTMMESPGDKIDLKIPGSEEKEVTLGKNTKDALKLLRKNTSQTKNEKVMSLLKHLGVGLAVGGLLIAGVATGGAAFIAVAAIGGAAYAGLTIHQAYKQNLRVENIQKLEDAHTRVSDRLELVKSRLADEIPGSQEHTDLLNTVQQLEIIKENIETTLRQTSPQHATQALIHDLLDVDSDGNPTEIAEAAHHALLNAGFNFTADNFNLLHGSSTKGLQQKLLHADKGTARLFRQEIMMSLEQFIA